MLIIKKKAVLQYFLLYLLLCFQGSNIYKLYDSVIMAVAIIFTGVYLLKYRFNRINTEYILWVIVICGLLLANHFYTNGSTSIGTVMNFFSRFCIAFSAYSIDKLNAKERLVKTVIFLASVSLLGFTWSLLPIKKLLVFLPTFNVGGELYKGGFLYSARISELGRNNGIYGEPGVYQIVLNIALIILLFEDCNWLGVKQRRKYLIILFLTLLTAQSTTGYLGMLIIVCCFVFSNSIYEDKKWIKLLLIVAVVLLAYIAIFGGQDSFINERFTSKLFDSGRIKIDLSQSTGRYRIISMTTDLIIAKMNPWGVGTDAYKTLWEKYVYDWTNTNGSVVGVTVYCARYGFLLTVLAITQLLRGFYRNSKSICHFFAMLGAFAVTITSQPHICYAIYIFMSYPIVESSLKRYKRNNKIHDY